MSGESSSASVQSDDAKISGSDECRITDETGAICGETGNLGILKHFHRIYADRMESCGDNNELAVRTLKSWVHDLTEQNNMLVCTVEELERELLKRVDMMHDQLLKTNYVIKRKDVLAKREKDAVEIGLRQQVELLQNDVSSLIDAINQAQLKGTWSFSDLKLNTVNKHELIGKPHSSCNEILHPQSQFLKRNFLNYEAGDFVNGVFPHADEEISSHSNHKSLVNEDLNSFLKVTDPSPQSIIHKTLDAAFEGNFETSFNVPLGKDSFYICSLPSLNNVGEKSIQTFEQEGKHTITQTNCFQKSDSAKESESSFIPDKRISSYPIEGISVISPMGRVDSKVVQLPAAAQKGKKPEKSDDVLLSSNQAHAKHLVCVCNDRPMNSSNAHHVNSNTQEEKIDIVSPHVKVYEKSVNSIPHFASSDYHDSLECITSKSDPQKETIFLSTAPKSHCSQYSDKEHLYAQSVPEDRDPEGLQENLKTGINCLKSQLAEKEAEISTYLERFEEIRGVLSQSTQQCSSPLPGNHLEETQRETSWIKEHLKKQQDHVISLTAKSLELETNLRMAIFQRDQLSQELQSLQSNRPSLSEIQTQTSFDPYVIQIKQELDTTRQNLLSATNRVKLLTTQIREAEEVNLETQNALTVEVAEKHDQILALKKETQNLEDQLKQAYVQTNYKEKIIIQMRNELKKARNKLVNEPGTDTEVKSQRIGFPSISETGCVSDSDLDDGEISVSSRCSNVELEQLLQKLNGKDKEITAFKLRIAELEKELEIYHKAPVKTVPPKAPLITLRELEEYRLCTVEAQAAVEDLKDEIEAITSDMKIQDEKMENFKKAVAASEDILQNAQLKLAHVLQSDPQMLDLLEGILADTKACVQDIQTKAEEFVRDRGRSDQRRASRERKVDKLQEQLDNSHDNMRDGIEAMEQVLAERYEADRLSQREFSDGSSYHSCRDSDSGSCVKQVQHLEKQNAELLNTLAKVENHKRDMEVRAAQYLREIDQLKDRLGRCDFNEQIVHTKEQTICELQGTLESTRRQMREFMLELERVMRERDGLKHLSNQNAGFSPSQVAELQSELVRVRNQLASLASKQALIEQYERRFQETSEQTEKLSSQLSTLTLNLQAKEKLLSNKEEMVSILQDTLNRTQEELKLLKDKSVSKSSFALPWRDGKKRLGGSKSVPVRTAEEAASDANGGASDEELLVRELRLDLSEMLVQYRDCFTEVSRQSRWYRDLRDAYQDLRSHAENIKKEALASVSSAQKELEVLKNKVHVQNALISQLKEQMWAADQARRRAELQQEELHQQLAADTAQAGGLRQQVDVLQSQLKEAKARADFSEEQEELRQLREFRDKCEKAARSLADADTEQREQQDCWGALGLSWCESAESEDSQKREARLQATLGLLLVEAGRRRAGGGTAGRDATGKDSDSDSTDRGGKSPQQITHEDPQAKPSAVAALRGPAEVDSSKCRVHGPGAVGAASAARRYQRESAERRRRLEQEKKNRALRNVARCEACRSFVKSPATPESDPRLRQPRRRAPPCACERVSDGRRRSASARPATKGNAPSSAQYAPCLLGPRPRPAPTTVPSAGAGIGPDDGPAKGTETEQTSTTETGSSGAEDDAEDQGAEVKQLFLAPRLLARLHREPPQQRSHTEQELLAQVASLRAELQCLGSCASVHSLDSLPVSAAVTAVSVPPPERAVATDAPEDAVSTADSAVQTHDEKSSGPSDVEVRALAAAARQELRGAVAREERRQRQEAAVAAETERARARVLRALCGAELEARLRDKEAERLRAGLRGALASALGWRQRARRLELYCSDALWSPEGQLQGALEENRELREQLCHLREHNAKLQAQCAESAHFLAGISSPLEDELLVRAGSVPATSPIGSMVGQRTLATLAAQVDYLQADKQALVEQNRALRCSLALGRASSASSRASDLTDPCDSGCWSLQASPPRAAPVPMPVHGLSSARLCWASSDSTGPSAPASVTHTPSGATAFILNARRPRGTPGAGAGAGAHLS